MLFAILCSVSIWKPRRVFAETGGKNLLQGIYICNFSFWKREVNFSHKKYSLVTWSWMERLPFTYSGFEGDPHRKFLWVRRCWGGEQKCQCQFAARRTHIVWFMPHETAQGKPDSRCRSKRRCFRVTEGSNRLYIRLCSLAGSFSPGRARTL